MMIDVAIRPLEREDAKTSYKWRNDPLVWKHTISKPDRKISPNDEDQWIQRVIGETDSKRFAILADDAYVGNVYLTDISNGEAEYHIFLGDKNYWGKGVARKASILIIIYGKNILHLEHVKLEVNRDNAAAYHLYESLGFIEMGNKSDDPAKMRLNLAQWNGDPRRGKV